MSQHTLFRLVRSVCLCYQLANHRCVLALQLSSGHCYSRAVTGACSSAPARKKGLGVCYFCCPIASTWVAQSWVFIILPRQVVWSYGKEGRGENGPRTITIETQCRQHQSAVPREVSKITPSSVPWGRWDTDSQLLIRFPSFRALSLSWPDVVVF